MIRKRLLAVLCVSAVAGSAVVLAAGTPGAQALCRVDPDTGTCPGGPRSTTTTRPLPPPTPPAYLRGLYGGSISGSGRTAQVVMTMTSTNPDAVSATVAIADGLHVDCHGDQTVGMVTFPLTGYRTAAARNGASTYYFHQEVNTSYSGVDVSLSLSTYATLSADGQILGGPISLHAGLPWYLSDCDLNWSFSTRAL